jgi:hypothetical protein
MQNFEATGIYCKFPGLAAMQRQNFRPGWGKKKDFQELELANNLAGTVLPLVSTEVPAR